MQPFPVALEGHEMRAVEFEVLLHDKHLGSGVGGRGRGGREAGREGMGGKTGVREGGGRKPEQDEKLR